MGQIAATHRRLLAQFRDSMNLIGPGPLDTQFEDCTRALAALPEPHGHWADLGTGAGFPGLVFADLHPEVRLDLVDSRKKRCWFLEQVLFQSGVEHQVSVRRGRLEQLPAAQYDGIMAKALAAPAEVVQIGLRLCKPGGQVLLFLQGDAEIPTPAGVTVLHVEHYELDGKDRKSALLQLPG